MKKHLFSTALILCTVTLFSQTEKGNKLVGGSAVLGIQTDAFESTIFQFNASPNLGFFISDNFALGGTVSIGFIGAEGASIGNVGLAPFARLYFGNSAKTKWFVNADLGVDVLFGDAEGSLGHVSAGPGVAFFLTPNTALELSLPLILLADLEETDGSLLDAGLRLGFQIHLPDKKE